MDSTAQSADDAVLLVRIIIYGRHNALAGKGQAYTYACRCAAIMPICYVERV